MKINGIILGSALILTGSLIKNLDVYMKESFIETLILTFMTLGCWHFTFDKEQTSGEKK